MKRGVLIIAGLAVLLVVVFVVVALVTRGNSGNQPKELTVYLPFDEVEVYEKISAAFVEANPGVELNFEYIEAEDAKQYEAKVVNEIADGEGPDIWLVRSDWIPKHAAKSVAIEPNSGGGDIVAAVKTVIQPSVVDLNVYQEKLYGVPLFADSLALIYNRGYYNEIGETLSESQQDRLRKFPATWDIVKDQTTLVSKKSGQILTQSGLAIGTAETMYAPADVLSALLVQRDARILSEDQSSVAFNLATFDDGKSIFPATEALKFLTSFARPSEPNYSWNNDMGNAVDAFKQEKTGAIIAYYSFVQELLEDTELDLAAAPLPQVSAKGERVDYGVSWSHIVSNQSQNPALARQFQGFLTRSEVQTAYAKETGKIPVVLNNSASVPTSVVRGKEALQLLFAAQLRTVRQLEKTEWISVDEYLQDVIKLVVNSKQSPQAAVDSIAEKMKELVR